MSARLKHPPEPKPEAKGKKQHWKVQVTSPEGDRSGANHMEPHIGVADLELAALDPTPLPWRTELERHFDTSLATFNAYQGPEVDAALANDNAAAAVQGDAVLLPRHADKPLVAHEVAHILQQRGDPPADLQAAEAEALNAEARVATGNPVPEPTQSLPADTVALRSTDALEEQSLTQGSDREAAAEFHRATQNPDAEAAYTTGTETEEAAATEADTTAGAAGESVLGDVAPGEPISEDPVPTFEPPAMPEIEVDEDTAEAAKAEAEAALEGAEEADGLIAAFKDAPPSIKAQHHDQLEGEVGEMAEADQTEFEANMPEFPAEMSGTDDLAESEPVQTPEAREAQLEAGIPAPAPEPQVDPTPNPGTANLNAAVRDFLSNFFSFGDAGSLGQTFNRVSTSDNDVDTSAGERPDVPLEGETGPQRVEDQDKAARDEAKQSRMEATQAVIEGPGPERVELRELREDYTMEARERPVIEQTEAVEGAAAFREKELDGEVVALFDQAHAEDMSASLEEAAAETAAAVEVRDTERDTKLENAEAERLRLNEEADEDQRTEVSNRRQEVQDARQHAVDQQQARVDDMETQADIDRQAAETEIDSQVSTTEEQVQTDFDQAETDAHAEVDDGERQAQEERDRQERESENKSWWERATDWVAAQFDKLTKFINDVFDAVRSAVKDIIDAVKKAAIALIDAAVSAITAAIEALGDALKAAVNLLLAEAFPELAEALNNAIDAAVEVATEAVKAIGEGLKAAVSALLDALAAAIDAILAAYQAAINAALAIAKAALTGDWAQLAKLILEPILYALGIEPAAFYEMIARAMEAIDIIIDDPIGFLSNLVEALVGGIRQFGSNLLTHLQQGIIGWLTGALGGDIQIPERFDLMGVLDLARQVLGLTVDMIRRIAVRILGEEAVERIEFFMGYVVELITGGFSALWDKIMADLSTLKDMVLDGIKSFLMERIVMAAITWLASLFSPVGALIKLVMTIWNFLMFLKDQLARIIQVVTTIVSTMWEIATGVLQPAIDGVEGVLGRLLPIVIDLLARLLGLGNVAGRVREIIANVRQRIEDAIVNLINRVLSAFTGGRMGGSGSGDGEDDKAAGDGQIMVPIAVRGGGESHTLYIEDQGEHVVPMIRSAPQTLQAWLDARTGAPFETLAAGRNWRGAVKINKKTQLESLVARAKEEEAQLDKAAEAADDAGADETPAADPATQTEGEQTKRALAEVLEFFGIDPNASLLDHFETALNELSNALLRTRLRTTVLNGLDRPRYLTMDWTQAKASMPGDAGMPGTWTKPASANAILLTLHEDTFKARVKAIVLAHIEDLQSTEYDAAENAFFADYLVEDLNRGGPARAIVASILEERDGTAIANEQAQVIKDAAERKFNGLDWDHAFGAVTGSYYKTEIVPNSAKLLSGNFGKYYADDAENVTGTGAGVDQPLTFFLTDGQSKRASKNRTRLANSVRDADAGNHEWIPSSRAASVITATAARLGGGAGDVDALAGLAKLLKFQHEVRTPTSDLIFKPNAPLSQLGRTVPYYSKAHADSHKKFDELSEDEHKQYYPEGGPQRGDPIIVLQAHAGGLDAGRVEDGRTVRGARLQWASPEWHTELGKKVDQPIADNIASNSDGTTIKTAILDYYRDTIWQGAVPLGGSGPRFDLYYTASDGQWRDYDALSKHAKTAYGAAKTQLETDMKKVFP